MSIPAFPVRPEGKGDESIEISSNQYTDGIPGRSSSDCLGGVNEWEKFLQGKPVG
jgi:hypothetical protein